MKPSALLGQVTLAFSLNGVPWEKVRFDQPGPQHFEREVPPGLLHFDAINLVSIEPDKIYIAKEDGAKLGFPVARVGFVNSVQLLLILFGSLFTVAVCLGCGRLLLRDACVDPGLNFVSGAAILSLAVFVIAALHAVYPIVFLGLGVLVLIGARRLVGFSRGNPSPTAKEPKSRISVYLLGSAFLVYFVIHLCHGLAPEASPDGSAYHLSLVSRYLREYGFHRITTNMYANLSQGMEMLFLFAFAFGKHSAAAMVHLAFLLALVYEMFTYSRRAGFPLAGACGAFLVFASPVVGIDGTSAYNDVAVAAIAFSLFYLLQLWDASRDSRLLVAAGLVAGFAFATKYTAFVAVPYALGYVGWKSRQLRAVVIVAACAALLIIPWMAKNWLWVQDPVSPFFNIWFPNPYVTPAFETEYTAYLRHYELSSLWQIPLAVTVKGGGLSGLLGPVFLLSPLALLALRHREGRRLVLAGIVFGATYFNNIGTRFLIPPLPFVALSLALALSAIPPLALALVLVHAVLSWPAIVPKYAAGNAWRVARFPWKEALRLRPEKRYLERWLPGYGVVRMIESDTASGSTIFTAQPLPEAYTSRNIRVDYESAENQMAGRILRTGALPDYAPTLRLRFLFPKQALRAIRIVQTNTGTDLWTIHELRVFDGAQEIPRRNNWRLRARPSPWGIQNAFDNSQLTFWISGYYLTSGMYVEVDTSETFEADSVAIETAPNQWQVRLRLEGMTASGGWRALSEAPQQDEEARPIGLRRDATAELKRRGIDYLLLFNSDPAAGDLERNWQLWGVRPIAKYREARLYQLP